jgi:serine/threonine protein kinase
MLVVSDVMVPQHAPTPGVYPRGTIIADKYRVEDVLGVGGMGVVVSAQHVLLRQRVALKFLLGDVGAADAERFFREAHAAARIQSEHICRVMDVGILPDGTPYIVMEKLEGKDLATVLREGGPLDPSAATDLVLEALDALSEAHTLGIIHRDLKPSNLFLAHRTDGSIILKVLDFGISKLESEDNVKRSLRGEAVARAHEKPTAMRTDRPLGTLTATFDVFGTPPYMPPEQLVSARDVDRRADIWSLGVILYELLAGARPFSGTEPELVRKILNVEYVPLDRLRPDVPAGLARVIDGCLRRSPNERFADAGALAAALAPFASSQSNRNVERVLRLTKSDENPALPMTTPRALQAPRSPRSPRNPAGSPSTGVQALAAPAQAPTPPPVVTRMATWVRTLPQGITIFVMIATIAGSLTVVGVGLWKRGQRSKTIAPVAASAEPNAPASQTPPPSTPTSPATSEPAVPTTASAADAPSASASAAPRAGAPPRGNKAKPRASPAPNATTPSTASTTDGLDLGRL